MCLEVSAAPGASAPGVADAAAASAGGLGRLDVAARFGAVGEAVGLPRETETAGDVAVRPRLYIDAFHLPLENGAYEKRNEDSRGARNDDRGYRAAAHGLPLLREREIFPTRGQIVRKAAVPVVFAEVIEKHVLDLFLPIFVESILALGTIVEVGEGAVIHAQKEDRAVPLCANAERVVVVNGVRRLVCAAAVDTVGIFYRDKVNADAVALRDALRGLFERSGLARGEDTGVIRYVRELRTVRERGGGESEQE